MKTRYILKTRDGRMVTNDTQNGVSLTKIPALCYVWECKETAERERVVYQAILGTALSVEINVPTTLLRT